MLATLSPLASGVHYPPVFTPKVCDGGRFGLDCVDLTLDVEPRGSARRRQAPHRRLPQP